MMQRIAILPQKIVHPKASRCLNKFAAVYLNGIRFASSATRESKLKVEKDDKPFINMEVPERRPLYLDAQATNPMDPRVLDVMLPYLTHQYGNPHSRNHFYGWESEKAVEIAREQVANLIGADPKEIIFTSGATESNNIALKGVARFYGEKRNHIITTQTEHKCVLDSCRALEAEGFNVTYLPVQTNGLVDLKQLERAINPQTALVSVMAVHNEIGVQQPISDISAICQANKVLFHTDAAQAVGKIPIDVRKQNINLMSISGHKIYGPKGVGALFVGRKPRVRLVPIQSGGGQERGLRSGTVPAPLVVGLGAACAIAQREMSNDKKWVEFLSKRLYDKIMNSLPHVIRNGDPEQTYPGCLNLSFAYVEGESLMMALKDIALSSGSACTSASLEPSYVLRAIGTDDDLAHSSIRFNRKERNHLITVQTEHKCILQSGRALQSEGVDVTFLPVEKDGLINLELLEKTITSKTALVSVMTVNNEIGVHQPIAEIGALCEKKGVLFHTDAAQATGKVPIDVRKHKIHLMSMSAHKVYGPKGVGALFVSKNPQIKLIPIQDGGGQERGLRSGTLPAPLVVGFGAACEVAQQEMKYDTERITELSQRFRDKIMENLTHVHRNGSDKSSYPGCFNLSFAGVEGESLLMGLKSVALSSGSACTSESLEPSYVLKALGIPNVLAHSSIRFGIGRFTTVEEIDYTAEKCIAQVTKLREMSPLWEMVQEGVDLKTIIWAQH